MNLINLKNKLGLNMFALLGYLPLTFIYILGHGNYPTIGIFIYTFMFGCLAGLSLLIWIFEIILKHKIKSKFILENPYYNNIWIIGFTSSILFTLFFIFILGTEIMHMLGFIK